MTTVAAKRIIVNLDDSQQAVIDREYLILQDAAAHTPALLTALSLDDAITVAKAILSFVHQLEAEQEAEQEQAAADETISKYGIDAYYGVSRWD